MLFLVQYNFLDIPSWRGRKQKFLCKSVSSHRGVDKAESLRWVQHRQKSTRLKYTQQPESWQAVAFCSRCSSNRVCGFIPRYNELQTHTGNAVFVQKISPQLIYNMCTGWTCASIPIKHWEITERSCHTLLGWYWLFWLFISLLSISLLNNTVKKLMLRNPIKGCFFYHKKYSSRLFKGMDIFCLKFKLVGCTHTFCAEVWSLSHVCTKMQMSCTDQIRYVSSVYLSKEAESRDQWPHILGVPEWIKYLQEGV